MAQKTILITGCSTGIGYACAKGLKERGYRIFATARKPEDLTRLRAEGLEAIALDYRDSGSVKACAAEVAERTGGELYALFNNGAYGQPGAVEDITRPVLEEQFAANFFGWHWPLPCVRFKIVLSHIGKTLRTMAPRPATGRRTRIYADD